MATIPDAFDDPDRMPSENGVAASFRLGDAWVLVLRGEIDLDDIAPVGHEVARALRHEGMPVLFDMSQLSFCDSSTLNLLLRTRQRTAVALIRPTAWVDRLLGVAGIRDLLPAFDTTEQATRALAQSVPGTPGTPATAGAADHAYDGPPPDTPGQYRAGPASGAHGACRTEHARPDPDAPPA